MLDIQVRKLITWPGKPNTDPKSSQFKCGYKVTVGQLKDELFKANYVAGSVVLELYVDDRMIVQDGTRLRADAKPFKPGVILRFSRRTGKIITRGDQRIHETHDVSYPCDAFDWWQDNLRAICLSMESLRRVERYGVFKYDDIISRLALPTAEGKVSTRESAAAFMAQHSGLSMQEILADSGAKAAAYKKAAISLHPDSPTGDNEQFLKLQECLRTLMD